MGDKNINIAMLSIHSCPVGQLGTKDTGGMSVYIREIARLMGRQGHSVDIFTRDHDPDHPKIMTLGENVRLIHLTAGDPDDLSKLSVYPHIKAYAMELDAFCKTHKMTYDIIHSHYWLSGLVGKHLQALWNKPHMIMFHTLGIIKNKLGIGKPEPELRLSHERVLAKHSHKIVAPTKTEKKYILEYLGTDENKIVTIPCGVNQDLFCPMDKQIARKELGLGQNDNVILYVGRVEPLKGLDRILQAVSRLNDKMPVKLVVAGGDQHHTEEMQEILTLVKELKIENAVTFAGRVDQHHLPYYYNATDVLAVASLYESFGLVALEALSCGTPVVSTPVGGMKTVIQPGKTGFLTNDPSIDTLANGLNQIIGNKAYYETRSNKIRTSVSHLSWKVVTQALLSEYRSLIRSYPKVALENGLSHPSLDLKHVSCS